MPEQSLRHQKDSKSTLLTFEGDTYENRPDAGYPRGNHRIIRASACCIQEEGID